MTCLTVSLSLTYHLQDGWMMMMMMGLLLLSRCIEESVSTKMSLKKVSMLP